VKFTVIIPTRERADTLYYSLKTCVTQDYDNLEILVSDNFSQDNTREVVESFKDPRIRYINTGERVSMTSNWEFALSHVDQGYVMMMGDDDGLMPNGVIEAHEILRRQSVQVLACCPVLYWWPSFDDKRFANLLRVYEQNILYESNASNVLRAAKYCVFRYGTIPMLYNSFVDVGVCSILRQRTNRVFQSMSPDVYSGFAVMSVVPRWLFSTRPFLIRGTSGHSIGASFAKGNPTDTTYRRFLTEKGQLPCHPKMRMISGIGWTAYLESMLQANDFCFQGRLDISMRRALMLIFKTLFTLESSAHQTALEQAREIAREHGLERFGLICEKLYHHVPGQQKRRQLRDRPGAIDVDAPSHHVTNVYTASTFAADMMGEYGGPPQPKPFPYFGLIIYPLLEKIWGVRTYSMAATQGII
jgi:glycosyltransferase involved in cell wall biosynthesis